MRGESGNQKEGRHKEEGRREEGVRGGGRQERIRGRRGVQELGGRGRREQSIRGRRGVQELGGRGTREERIRGRRGVQELGGRERREEGIEEGKRRNLSFPFTLHLLPPCSSFLNLTSSHPHLLSVRCESTGFKTFMSETIDSNAKLPTQGVSRCNQTNPPTIYCSLRASYSVLVDAVGGSVCMVSDRNGRHGLLGDLINSTGYPTPLVFPVNTQTTYVRPNCGSMRFQTLLLFNIPS